MTPELEKELAKIYVGQNIRMNAPFGVKKGIISSDVDSTLAKELLSMGLINEEHFYNLQLYVTTPEADSIIKPQLQAACKLFDISQYCDIPQRITAFVIGRYISRGRNFPAEQPISETEFTPWEDRLLLNPEVWNFCAKFLRNLEEKNLCVEAHYFVASQRGKRQERYFVASQEFQKCLNEMPIHPVDFSEKDVKGLCIYEVLIRVSRHFEGQGPLVGFGLEEYFKLLEERELLEENIKPFVDKASLSGLTSKYEQLPNRKPFEVCDLHRFQAYLYTELIKPKIELLLEDGTEEEF